MLLIPPLLVNNSFETDFKEKANLFEIFFCKQCTRVANGWSLPPSLATPNETLSSLEIIASDIEKIIQTLNVNKAHSHGKIAMRMLKICESDISNHFFDF